MSSHSATEASKGIEKTIALVALPWNPPILHQRSEEVFDKANEQEEELAHEQEEEFVEEKVQEESEVEGVSDDAITVESTDFVDDADDNNSESSKSVLSKTAKATNPMSGRKEHEYHTDSSNNMSFQARPKRRNLSPSKSLARTLLTPRARTDAQARTDSQANPSHDLAQTSQPDQNLNLKPAAKTVAKTSAPSPDTNFVSPFGTLVLAATAESLPAGKLFASPFSSTLPESTKRIVRNPLPSGKFYSLRDKWHSLCDEKHVYWSNQLPVGSHFNSFTYDVSDVYPRSKKSFELFFVGTRMWSFILQDCCHVPMAQRIAFPARVKKFLRTRIYGNDDLDLEEAPSYIKLVNLHDVGTMETLFLPTRGGIPEPDSPILQLVSFDYN